MQKNIIMAFALSFLVYGLWFSWMSKKYKGQPAAPQTSSSASLPAPANPDSRPAVKGETAPAAVPPQSDRRGLTDGQAQTQDYQADDNWKKQAVEFKIPKAAVYIHPEGAAITSFKFDGPLGQVELVPHPKPGFFAAWPKSIFKLSERTGHSATFTAAVSKNIAVTKKYVWDPDGGINTLEISAQNTSNSSVELEDWDINLGPGLGTVKSEESENKKLQRAAYAVQEEGKKHPSVKLLAKSAPSSKWLWAGMDNRYFLAAAAPLKWESFELGFSQINIEKDKIPSMSLIQRGMKLAPGQKAEWKIGFYFGPKDYAKLEKLGSGLDRAVDFGTFSPLAKLANSTIGYLYEKTGNYGWAILILTIILQIIMIPLTWKSAKATYAMKKLQPQIQLLQKKYKSDPKRMNVETMQLYKTHGANPLGGCLPMLLQIPVFIALFTTLRNSWVLHGAPFVFWITDLSSKDPYYVLPIVMGGIMFAQQSLNPQAGDPAQAAVMKWMPVLFTFMFLNFPSGLVLYWLTNSIVGFIQQIYMNKIFQQADVQAAKT